MQADLDGTLSWEMGGTRIETDQKNAEKESAAALAGRACVERGCLGKT